jgi:hypothetical protein
MPLKPPSPPVVFPVRASAPHVRAAVAQHAQAKMPQRPASHVQAAVAPVQRKASPPPPVARQAAAPPAPPVRRSPAPHVRAASVQCARAAAQPCRRGPAPVHSPRPGVIQRSSVDLSAVDARKSFRYLGSTEQDQFKKLSQDVKQELFKNGKLNLSESAKFSSATESSYLAMLEHNRPLHLGSNPDLGTPWQSIVKSTSSKKTGAALYSAIRSPGYSAALKKLGIDPVTALKLAGGSPKKAKAPEVHHLVYKKEEPQSAVLLWNLMLATRGSSDGPLGLHEMLHSASSPQGRPNISQSVYLNEVPAVKGLIRQWAQGPRPTVTLPNVLHTPSHDILEQLFGISPLGPSTLSYTPSFVSEEPSLSFLERDNSYFGRQGGLNQTFLQWIVDDEHDHWDELDRLLELETVVDFGSTSGSFGSPFGSFGSTFGASSSSSFVTPTFTFPTYTPPTFDQLPSLFPTLDGGGTSMEF